MTAPSIHVALVHPEIPWNTGNVGRTCLAAGAALHLIRPLGFSLANKEVRRAGLDYWEKLDLRIWNDWDSFEGSLPDLGEPVLFSAEGERTLWQVSYPTNVVLVFGRESVGLPGDVRARFADRLVRIPIFSEDVRSLNLSTCVALALYEVARRRHVDGRRPRDGGGPASTE